MPTIVFGKREKDHDNQIKNHDNQSNSFKHGCSHPNFQPVQSTSKHADHKNKNELTEKKLQLQKTSACRKTRSREKGEREGDGVSVLKQK